MALEREQTAIIQSQEADPAAVLPLTTSSTEAVPPLPSIHHVLVRVLTVALNPNDHKMLAHFPMPGSGVGCDFCGIVESASGGGGEEDPDFVNHRPGTRVCGTLFPYAAVGAGDHHHRMGSFAEYVVVDSRLLLRVPDRWSDLQGAALGGVGWSTVGLAMSGADALALPGRPSTPAEEEKHVLVYGGGTATGTMAIQMLRLSGYAPLAITQSAESAALAVAYGAVNAVRYTGGASISDCLESIRSLTAGGPPLRHALDCITDADSAAVCFGALARTGGRYACLEHFQHAWRTRRVVRVKEVMGYEVLGRSVDLGGPESTYTRGENQAAVEAGREWAAELQALLDKGALQAHPTQQVSPSDEKGSSSCPWARAVESGLQTLMVGGVRGRKLVVRISQ
ncbi:hypothetical protein Daus18300_004083 [Diaporthe australafricana]|uniref:Alcohol dehydrogenase-like N-terminal domain-containing protein n=1 Tax=Diaporthe australafricana TaxID=127596 RepID=A0ABR3XAT7_9PEZI